MSIENVPTDPTMATIAFGLDVEAFMGTNIGRFLSAKANADIESAFEEWKRSDPEDVKTMRDLQNRVVVAEQFLMWIGEAVTEGENSERQIREAGE